MHDRADRGATRTRRDTDFATLAKRTPVALRVVPMKSMPRLEERLADRFRIDAHVGEGGMGVVYRGVDLACGETVAIKVLQQGAVDNVTRFAREASALATIDHPGIVRYVAHGTTLEGDPFLVMEWIEGVTLEAHLVKLGVTAAEGLALVRRVGLALAPAHARGLVHRDLKPANILLADGDVEQPKVIDFGLARQGFGDARLTETGTAVGTPSFMSPEQARGEREIDARTDSFALGCVLYECLTGVPAFGGRNAAAIMARIVMCEPPALRKGWPAAPVELERAVSRMLSKTRDGRPADGGAVAAMLESIAVPDTPRRRRLDSSTMATEVGGPTATYVIFVQSDDVDETAIRPALAPFDARIEKLLDGALVAVLHKDAATAARCALAVRRCLPDAAIVIAGPQDQAETAVQLTVLLDAAGAALELADFGQMFAGDLEPSAIRIDEATATKLGGGFVIERARAGAVFLISERGAP